VNACQLREAAVFFLVLHDEKAMIIATKATNRYEKRLLILRMEKFLTYGKFTTPHIKTQNHLKYYIPTHTTSPYSIIAGIHLGRGLVGWVVVGF
jgi:hypothetical protein